MTSNASTTPAHGRAAVAAPLADRGPQVRCVADVFEAARIAQRSWAARRVGDRVAVLRRFRHGLAAEALAVAEATAGPRGRPTREALTAEVLPLAEACRAMEKHAGRVLSPRRVGGLGRPIWLWGVSAEVRRDPWGVILVIGPGNYPLFLPGVQVLQALVAGNAVIVKPGLAGSAAAVSLAGLLVRAGLEPDLVSVLPEEPAAALAAIDAGPDKVLFTGSAATGQHVLATLAPKLIPATMELGGHDAAVVRADADLDLVVRALEFGTLLNGGATCLAPRRVVVDHKVATELEGRLAQSFAARASIVLEGTAAASAFAAVSAALEQGAHVLAGTCDVDGRLTAPLIVGGVSPRSRLWAEDFFLPVVSICVVDGDAEALAVANQCPYGLGASVFSRDEDAARRVAAGLVAGVVTINDVVVPTADARLPFGGRRRSGYGVTRGPEGLLELTVPKVVTISRGRRRLAWEPPQAGDAEFFAAYLNLAHGDRWRRRLEWLPRLLRAARARRRGAPQ